MGWSAYGELIGQVVVMAGLVGAGTFGMLRKRRVRAEAWTAAATGEGVTDVVTAHTLFTDEMAGQYGGLTVRFHRLIGKELARGALASQTGLIGSGEPMVRLTIEGLAAGVAFAPEQTGLLKRQSPLSEMQVGDPTFDAAVYVQGPPALLFALLDPPTRTQIVSALLWSAVVANGVLKVDVPLHYAGGSGDPLPVTLRLMLRLAERLRRPADLAECLHAHVRDEPVEEVRLWNLMTLAREYPEHPLTAAALEIASGDDSDEIRLRAALMRGAAGRKALLSFATGDAGDETCAARAVEALAGHLGPEQAHAILARALRERRLLVARAAMGAVARLGDDESLRTLGRILAVEKGDLAEAAATALGATGRGAAEAPLVSALDHPAGFVRAAAAAALGRVGSVGAVLPLREAEGDPAGDAELRRAARQAVVAIQARCGETSPGQLTLAEGESGRLSLAEGGEGRVSLAEPSAKRSP